MCSHGHQWVPPVGWAAAWDGVGVPATPQRTRPRGADPSRAPWSDAGGSRCAAGWQPSGAPQCGRQLARQRGAAVPALPVLQPRRCGDAAQGAPIPGCMGVPWGHPHMLDPRALPRLTLVMGREGSGRRGQVICLCQEPAWETVPPERGGDSRAGGVQHHSPALPRHGWCQHHMLDIQATLGVWPRCTSRSPEHPCRTAGNPAASPRRLSCLSTPSKPFGSPRTLQAGGAASPGAELGLG